MVSQGRMTRDVINAGPELSVIVKHGSGVNDINLHAAESRNIPVYRGLGANARAVAEHAVTLALSLWKTVPKLDSACKSGKWLKGDFIGNDIHGAVIGLIGFGAIGRETANLALALGMQVRVMDPAAEDLPEGVQRVADLDELLRVSDIVSLHCPLVPATRELINAKRLKQMKSTAVLVNTARGGIHARFRHRHRDRSPARRGRDDCRLHVLYPGKETVEEARRIRSRVHRRARGTGSGEQLGGAGLPDPAADPGHPRFWRHGDHAGRVDHVRPEPPARF